MKIKFLYKVNILIISSMVIITMMEAQGAKFGIRAGVIISRQEFKSGSLNIEPDSKFGADVALVSDFSLLGFSIGPELHWLQKGYKIKDIQGNPGEFTSTFNYLELPVLFKLNFGIPVVKVFVMAGPSFGYLLDHKTTNENGNTVNLFGNENYKVEVGGQLGAGAGLGQVRVDIRYLLGLTNIAKNYPFVEKVRNSGFDAGVSLMF